MQFRSAIRVKVTTEEMRKHCQERSDFHEREAVRLTATLPTIRETVERIRSNREGFTPSMLYDAFGQTGAQFLMNPDEPIRRLESDIQMHSRAADRFDFLAAHLLSQDYLLTMDELAELEFIQR